MSHTDTLPAPWSLPSGGGLLALIELAVSFLTRERLTVEVEPGRCLGTLFQGARPAVELTLPSGAAPDPLAFLSDPSVPVPLARAYLSALTGTEVPCTC